MREVAVLGLGPLHPGHQTAVLPDLQALYVIHIEAHQALVPEIT